MTDDRKYQQHQQEQEQQWERLCRNCGACCGAFDGDPCEELIQKNGQFFCCVYENRFGKHKTLKGKEIVCVPIRQILHNSWPGDQNCAYKNRM